MPVSYDYYVKGQSFFHKLDPRAKLVWVFILLILSVAFNHPLYLGTMFAAILLVAILSKLPLKRLWLFSKASIYFSIIAVILWSIFVRHGNILVEFGVLKLTDKGMLLGLGFGFRISLLMFAVVVVLMTTKQKDLITGLAMMKVPYPVVFILASGLRFIPALTGEMITIREAQEVRGLEFSKGGIIERLKKFYALGGPLISRILKISTELSLAMDARAYDPAFKKRTFYGRPNLTGRDIMFIGVNIAFLAIGLVLSWTGYGVIPYL